MNREKRQLIQALGIGKWMDIREDDSIPPEVKEDYLELYVKEEIKLNNKLKPLNAGELKEMIDEIVSLAY